MDSPLYISHYCKIEKGLISVDGNVIFHAGEAQFSDFIKQAFKYQQLDYPKFYKMDNLSKLAFLSAEVLLRDEEDKEDIALVLANKSGSLDTDVKHQESIQDAANFYPSPAVFVYTLANICGGEISIRHGMKSEQVFFVSDAFDATTIFNYATYLLASQKAKKVLCGWVELFEENYKAVLYLVERSGTKLHTINNINQLVKN
ncbi:3-oxoacyl-ACP synthase [Sphingobacterium olei]|uniref:3-oxoacyl-ACP synthase n=1 Tax=Sphingobacterium olei TaxID=2571155 RepID=A0A4U0P3R8_9SPHI|nr:3-oxoacyl-ACP synthase [Sphingobacterium olei]TJZ61933.1 3-oxoacyl-ACP synthase [Sphingobacterium olei]